MGDRHDVLDEPEVAVRGTRRTLEIGGERSGEGNHEPGAYHLLCFSTMTRALKPITTRSEVTYFSGHPVHALLVDHN